MLRGQAVRQQKEEVRRKQNGAANGQDGQNGHGAAADGEDVHMRRGRGQRSARKRRRGAADVEMVDAEVPSTFSQPFHPCQLSCGRRLPLSTGGRVARARAAAMRQRADGARRYRAVPARWERGGMCRQRRKAQQTHHAPSPDGV